MKKERPFNIISELESIRQSDSVKVTRTLSSFRANMAERARNEAPTERTIRNWARSSRLLSYKSCEFLIQFCDHEIADNRNFDREGLLLIREELQERIYKFTPLRMGMSFGRMINILEAKGGIIKTLYPRIKGVYLLLRPNDDEDDIEVEILVVSHEWEKYIICYNINHRGEVFFGYLMSNAYSQYCMFCRQSDNVGLSMKFVALNFPVEGEVHEGRKIHGALIRNRDRDYINSSVNCVLVKLEGDRYYSYEKNGDVFRGVGEVNSDEYFRWAVNIITSKEAAGFIAPESYAVIHDELLEGAWYDLPE